MTTDAQPAPNPAAEKNAPQLDAPVAMLAGASRGLGLLLARELHSRGYRLALLARDEESLRRAATEFGPDAHITTGDVRDREGMRRWADDVERELGPVEVAITVAGIIQVGPAEDMTPEHFDEAIDIMTKGPINVAFAVLPHMRGRGFGRIGTVTSIGGMVSPPHLWPYATAKFGAVGFSDGLSAALAGTGVTATTIVPGLMRTGSHGRATFTGDAAAESAWFSVAASMPLLSARGEHAARVIVDGVTRGRPMVVVTPLAQAAIRVRGVAPGLVTRMLGLANRLLPAATGNAEAVEGRSVRSKLPEVVRRLTTLGEQAAARNNEE